MSLFTAIPQPLSRFIRSQLRRSLPPAVMDAPEDLEVQELVAEAAIARLAPANTAEALLAVQAVAAEAHASDALQAVHQYRDDFRRVGQCRAQSALMIRQSMALRRELRAVQEIRLEALRQQEEVMEAAALAAAMAGDTGEAASGPRESVGPETDDSAPDESQNTRQNPTPRSRETNPWPPRHSWPTGHRGLVLLAAFILASARNDAAPPARGAVHDAA